jgi:XTP/dITP diphosphohydrolase
VVILKIVLATNNMSKLKEVREILGEGYEVVSQREAGADFEVVEDTGTFMGNALKKAREVAKVTGALTVADDSGLCVDVLDGAPGVDSAIYSGGDSGRCDDANNEKLLQEMQGKEDRRALFVCAIAVVYPDGREHIIKKAWHGEIAHECAGENGFGYDKVFIPEGYAVTSAQLEAEEKNAISHRGKALRQLAEELIN